MLLAVATAFILSQAGGRAVIAGLVMLVACLLRQLALSLYQMSAIMHLIDARLAELLLTVGNRLALNRRTVTDDTA